MLDPTRPIVAVDSAMKHEWDWPETDPAPPRIRRTVVIQQAAPRSGWASPAVTRFCDGFFSVVVKGAVGAFAAVVATIGLGAVWLIFTALSA